MKHTTQKKNQLKKKKKKKKIDLKNSVDKKTYKKCQTTKMEKFIKYMIMKMI